MSEFEFTYKLKRIQVLMTSIKGKIFKVGEMFIHLLIINETVYISKTNVNNRLYSHKSNWKDTL